jgi:hypothetical protein
MSDTTQKSKVGGCLVRMDMEYRCCKNFDGEILLERNLLDILFMIMMMIQNVS